MPLPEWTLRLKETVYIEVTHGIWCKKISRGVSPYPINQLVHYTRVESSKRLERENMWKV